METIRLRGHHLSDLAEYLFNRKLSLGYKLNKEEYGLGNIRKVKKLYKEIIRNSNKIIDLTDILDSVCDSNCKRRDRFCMSEDYHLDDIEEIKAYGLKMGKVSSKEIIDKIKEFKRTHMVRISENGRSSHIASYRIWKILRYLNPGFSKITQ